MTLLVLRVMLWVLKCWLMFNWTLQLRLKRRPIPAQAQMQISARMHAQMHL